LPSAARLFLHLIQQLPEPRQRHRLYPVRVPDDLLAELLALCKYLLRGGNVH